MSWENDSLLRLLEEEQQYTVTVKNSNTDDDGETNNYTYTLRGLCTQEEVHRWATFCASVFSYKVSPPPAEYFLRHYVNDPHTIMMMSRAATATNAGRNNENTDRSYSSVGDHNNNQQQPRHYYYLPSLYIRVAMLGDEIVSSCRIFFRTISCCGNGGMTTSLVAAGIGEVCTSSTHRNRGLAKALMDNAMTIIMHRSNHNNNDNVPSSRIQEQQQQLFPFHISFLHCGPDFAPFYSRLGYNVRSRTDWSTILWTGRNHKDDNNDDNNHNGDHLLLLGSQHQQWSIRPAYFPQDTPQLQRLHQKYSEHRFVGCIIRSISYWNNYLSKELQGSIYVLVVVEDSPNRPTTIRIGPDQEQSNDWHQHSHDEGTIVGWLSIRPRSENHFQLREFGVDRERISTKVVLQYLLQHALEQEKGVVPATKGPKTSSSNTVITLSIPTFILDDIRRETNNNNNNDDDEAIVDDGLWRILNEKEPDTGWMYRVIDQDAVDTAGFKLDSAVDIDVIKTDLDRTTTSKHFIWPADSF